MDQPPTEKPRSRPSTEKWTKSREHSTPRSRPRPSWEYSNLRPRKVLFVGTLPSQPRMLSQLRHHQRLCHPPPRVVKTGGGVGWTMAWGEVDDGVDTEGGILTLARGGRQAGHGVGWAADTWNAVKSESPGRRSNPSHLEGGEAGVVHVVVDDDAHRFLLREQSGQIRVGPIRVGLIRGRGT